MEKARSRGITQYGAVVALGGGGGLLHWIVRLIIWRELFRLLRYLWRIPTFGPFIVVVIGLLVVGLIVWRSSGCGPRWRPPGSRGGPGSGSTGYGSESGPRDW